MRGAAVLNAAPTRNYARRPADQPTSDAGVRRRSGRHAGDRACASACRSLSGHYATAAEVTGPAPSDRSVTIVGGEGEYAFGYTKISGEIVRSRFERSVGSAVAYEWFVQGIQTLSPRWFVAGRHESTLAPPLITATLVGRSTRLAMVEATVGFPRDARRHAPQQLLHAQVLWRIRLGPSSGRLSGVGAEVVVISPA